MVKNTKTKRLYESKQHPLISRMAFLGRMGQHFAVALIVVGVSIFGGMVGYWHFEGHSWVSAFMHTCFLLGGYGHLTAPQSGAGQIFLGIYMLYSNLVFISVLGVLLAPVLHRIMHKFHLDQDAEPKN